MIAYHGKNEVRDFYTNRVRLHQSQDEIIQGTGWENGKGCAVGCTLHSYQHDGYPIELGIPIELAYLQDCIFEGLPNSEAKNFPLRFLESIKVGADLTDVARLWKIANLEKLLISQESSSYEKRDDILEVLRITIQALGENDNAAESAAESAAWSAARSAESAAWSAESAARSAAESAAWSAWSAESAARSAARSAAWSAESAARSAESAYFIWARDQLLAILDNAPVK
jgi:hypothetical protein